MIGLKAFLEYSAIWVGWLVALFIFLLYLLGERLRSQQEKRLRQTVGDYAQKIRAMNSIIQDQKKEISDGKATLQKVLDIDKFLIDRLNVTERATPRENE